METPFQKILLLKNIKYTRHAKNRIKWRKISDKEIKQVLYNPAEIKKLGVNRYSCCKTISQRKIKVIFIVEEKQILIITAFDKTN